MEIEKASFPRSIAYSQAYFKKYFKKCPEGFIVAAEKRGIAGYAIGQLGKEEGEFVSLAVKQKFRQKGIGTQLTNFLINLFKKGGAKKISLNARVRNKKAVAFYKKLGFEIVRTDKKYYRNGDDAYMMVKEI